MTLNFFFFLENNLFTTIGIFFPKLLKSNSIVVQSNLSNTDPKGTKQRVCIRGVRFYTWLIFRQKYSVEFLLPRLPQLPLFCIYGISFSPNSSCFVLNRSPPLLGKFYINLRTITEALETPPQNNGDLKTRHTCPFYRGHHDDITFQTPLTVLKCHVHTHAPKFINMQY